jgi:hypothetical protein
MLVAATIHKSITILEFKMLAGTKTSVTVTSAEPKTD